MIIALLLGAGGPPRKETKPKLKSLVNAALAHALEQPEEASASDVAVAVTSFLEDAPLTNAGTGSELTRAGTVECEASLVVMNDTQHAQASVGCLAGVRHPSEVAQLLLKEATAQPPSAMARPIFMVGKGASDFALANGLEAANLETPGARRAFEYWSEQAAAATMAGVASTDGPVDGLEFDESDEADGKPADNSDDNSEDNSDEDDDYNQDGDDDGEDDDKDGQDDKDSQDDQDQDSDKTDSGKLKKKSKLTDSRRTAKKPSDEGFDEVIPAIQDQRREGGPDSPYQDTVGVLVIDDRGERAACSSSGGTLLKFPGRIGPAGVPGAACQVTETALAVSSGFGDDMVACNLASAACEHEFSELPSYLEKFKLQRDPYFGILKAELTAKGWRMEASHSTESMVYGWVRRGETPIVRVSEKPGVQGTML